MPPSLEINKAVELMLVQPVEFLNLDNNVLFYSPKVDKKSGCSGLKL